MNEIPASFLRRLLALEDFHFVARQESIPGHARLDCVVTSREPGSRDRDRDEVVAGRTLNLFARIAFIALNVPVTVRTGEFEFAHSCRFVIGCGERPGTPTHRRYIKCEMHERKGSKIFGKVF